MTFNEVCEYLKVPRDTLYGWISKKRIPAIRISRKMVRFRKEDVDAWLESKFSGTVSIEKNAFEKAKKRKKSRKADDFIEKIVMQAIEGKK